MWGPKIIKLQKVKRHKDGIFFLFWQKSVENVPHILISTSLLQSIHFLFKMCFFNWLILHYYKKTFIPFIFHTGIRNIHCCRQRRRRGKPKSHPLFLWRRLACHSTSLANLNDFCINQKRSKVCLFSPGDDGVFHMNKTSGCITLQTLPIYLKREIFNIKVRVSLWLIHPVLEAF